MLNHNEIIASKFVRMNDGTVVDMNPALPVFTAVMTESSVGNGYYNLLRASGMMYTTLHLQFEALGRMIDFAEAVGADNIVPELLQMQTGINVGMRVALEGIERVSESLQNKKF